MRRLLIPASLLLLLAACYGPLGPDDDGVRPLDPSLQQLPATDIFELAASDWDVPRDLLVPLQKGPQPEPAQVQLAHSRSAGRASRVLAAVR